MDLRDTVRHLLQHEPGAALCDACLAFACDVSLSQIWLVTEGLVESSALFWRHSMCISCRRSVPSTVYGAEPKCAHCSRPLIDGQVSITIEGDTLHDTCLRLLLADENIRISQALSRKSRELIQESRRLKEEGRIRRDLERGNNAHTE